jgi:peptidoglycan/LPS O-acetylase OafA/YrhL
VANGGLRGEDQFFRDEGNRGRSKDEGRVKYTQRFSVLKAFGGFFPKTTVMGNCTKLGNYPFKETGNHPDQFKTTALPNTQQDKPSSKFRFKPQLSGLRFCAVLFVVIYHFSVFLTGLKWQYDLGSFIVFFFVLSSYLITRILLDAKLKALEKGMPFWKVAVNFLTRRTLRIFPAYYLYLVILMLFPLEGLDLRQHPGYYFGYIYNIWILITHSWGPYAVHLWTLAVEEQFYIIWPWIILFIPTRHLPKAFGIMVLGGIAFRFAILTFAPQVPQFPMLVQMPACIDSFAAGALLAYFHYRGMENNQWLKWASLIAIPVWILLIITNHHRSFIGLDRVFISFYSLTLIDIANRGYKGFLKIFLENRIVQYLSKISYGIYLYHLIAALFFWKFFEVIQRILSIRGYDLSFAGKFLASPYVSFWIYFVIAIGCATISWYCLEKPFNNLKKLFDYVKKPKAQGLKPKAQSPEPEA